MNLPTTERHQNTKVRRAWNNRLDGINNLLFWMYKTDVLNKGEKAKKDSIFRQYYRYYNDGDAPRGVLRKYGISVYNKELLEKRLEQYLEDFVCVILNKYKGKYDKTAYLTYIKNTNIESVASDLEYDIDARNLECIKQDEDLTTDIVALTERKTNLRNKLIASFPKYSSYTLSYILDNVDASDADFDEFAVIESRKTRLANRVRNLKI